MCVAAGLWPWCGCEPPKGDGGQTMKGCGCVRTPDQIFVRGWIGNDGDVGGFSC